MVVPVSLDPGRHDPRSPYYDGCPDCGEMGHGGRLCPDCEYQRDVEQRKAEQMEEEQQERQEAAAEARAVAGPENQEGDHE